MGYPNGKGPPPPHRPPPLRNALARFGYASSGRSPPTAAKSPTPSAAPSGTTEPLHAAIGLGGHAGAKRTAAPLTEVETATQKEVALQPEKADVALPQTEGKAGPLTGVAQSSNPSAGLPPSTTLQHGAKERAMAIRSSDKNAEPPCPRRRLTDLAEIKKKKRRSS